MTGLEVRSWSSRGWRLGITRKILLPESSQNVKSLLLNLGCRYISQGYAYQSSILMMESRGHQGKKLLSESAEMTDQVGMWWSSDKPFCGPISLGSTWILQIWACEQDSTWILELETKTEWSLPPRTQQSDKNTRRLGWDLKKIFLDGLD